jgi:hypothetical protein
MGNFSETPRKVFTYNNNDPSNCVIAATPTRKDEKQPLKSSMQWKSSSSSIDDDADSDHDGDVTSANTSSRPKTSRGTSHPSPDAFFDYVIPSPLYKKGNEPDNSASGFLNLVKSKSSERNSATKSGSSTALLKTKGNLRTRLSKNTEHRERSDKALKRQDEAIFTGCWLFGSLLRV